MTHERPVALVTGGGKRVGAAIATRLGVEGYNVVVHFHRSRDGAQETAEAIEAAGGQAELRQADLSSRGEAERLVGEVIECWGRLDLLICSAASFEHVPLADVDYAAWDRSMELCLTAPMSLATHAVGSLRASRGSIVFITCSSTTAPYKNFLPYQVAKAGVKQMMRVLALELAPEVRVNAVAPGTVLPPVEMSEAEIEALRAGIPLGRTGSAEAVAHAVVYLQRASWVTGQELLVDGGAALVGESGYRELTDQ